MIHRYTCGNGHNWTAPEGSHTVRAGVVCPVCQAEGTLIDEPDNTPGSIFENTEAESDLSDSLAETINLQGPDDTNRDASPDETIALGEEDSSHHADSTEASEPDVPGYEIIEELGQGAMGIVYKARQKRLNRIVALKMLVTAGHGASLARAQTEAESVAQLQHPNIVQIFEVQEHNGALFFAFEYVEGGVLNPDDVNSPRRAAELIEVLARGVHYAHEQGVIHRDLKPDNVLLTLDGTPKIADFGLAKRLETDSGQTQDGAIMGTPYYMAPEQAAGQVDAISPATDIYSLGGILYKLLTKQTPFDDQNIVQLLQKVRTAEPPAPRKIERKIHPDLETICLKCLEKAPLSRYATAADLADDLRRFLNSEPIEAKPIGPIERSFRWLRKRIIPVSLTVSLLIAAVLAVSLIVSSAEKSKARQLLEARAPMTIDRPAGLPSFSIPSDNPVTKGKVGLGKQLFFDRRLSIDNTVACVDCHHPDMGWADSREASVGIEDQKGNRNSPPVLNAAYLHFLFWDGRSDSLEDQATKPITNPIEMGVESLDDLVKKISGIEGYRIQFEQVFDDGVTSRNIGAALTAFERTLVAGDAPYDKFESGDKQALSESARRGMEVFFNEGHCSACHSGPLFTDGGFHNIGVGQSGEPVDTGRFVVTGRKGDAGSFKTPSLRDVGRTAPYMHDGSLKTLREVVEFYNRGGVANPQLDEEIYPLELTSQQKNDLIEFLKTGLASDHYPRVDPPVLPEQAD